MNNVQLVCTRMYLLLSTCLLLAACASSGGTRQTPQYQQWKNKAVQHYRYRLEIVFCPCEPSVIDIEVRNGTVVSETDATTGGPVQVPVFRGVPYNTIDHLFYVIEAAENRRTDEIRVEYDPTYGYPTSIWINEMSGVTKDGMPYIRTDNGIGYTITAFEILD